MQDATGQQQIDMIRLSTEQSEEKVALRDAIKALSINKHYMKVFTDHFFKTHIMHAVCLKASPGMQSPEDQKFINGQIDAVGQLDQFLQYLVVEGNTAERLIASNSEAIDSIRAEEGEEV